MSPQSSAAHSSSASLAGPVSPLGEALEEAEAEEELAAAVSS
jgi:hypothetical protein